jgi:hypothetical protein
LRRRFVRIGLALIFLRFVDARGSGFGLFDVSANVAGLPRLVTGFAGGFSRFGRGRFLDAA